MTTLDTVLDYHNRGLWVTLCCEPNHAPGVCTVPRKCHSPGKAPINAGWHKRRLTEEQIRLAFHRVPTLNVGIRWGLDSGLIDVETDTKAAERSLQELLAEAELPELVLIPTYQSRRGYHRLFRWCEGLPKATIKLCGIEFRCGGRGRGSQSVVPPSRHASGIAYEWREFLSLAQLEPPPLPAFIVELLKSQ